MSSSNGPENRPNDLDSDATILFSFFSDFDFYPNTQLIKYNNYFDQIDRLIDRMINFLYNYDWELIANKLLSSSRPREMTEKRKNNTHTHTHTADTWRRVQLFAVGCFARMARKQEEDEEQRNLCGCGKDLRFAVNQPGFFERKCN